MYIILEILGKQFKVKKNQYIYTPKLLGDTGSCIVFNKVLLLSNSNVKIGNPYISNVKVVVKIISQVKDNKVIVFKKKRRKGYKKKYGHRQCYTKVLIKNIINK